jgi:hypothetical protein
MEGILFSNTECNNKRRRTQEEEKNIFGVMIDRQSKWNSRDMAHFMIWAGSSMPLSLSPNGGGVVIMVDYSS